MGFTFYLKKLKCSRLQANVARQTLRARRAFSSGDVEASTLISKFLQRAHGKPLLPF